MFFRCPLNDISLLPNASHMLKTLFSLQQDSAAEAEGIEKMAANAASVMSEDTPNPKKDD